MKTSFNKIFFDFDSTLVACESLDLLAELRGMGDEIKKMTALSMSGELPLEQVMVKKMDMMRPSAEDIEVIVKKCEDLWVPGAKEVIAILQNLGKEVFILSSNFHAIIDPVVKDLPILAENIIANDIYFEHGKYVGINERSPLITSDGKFQILKSILKNDDRAVMVGDAMGDLRGGKAASLFIGFGGVEVRQSVKEKSEIYIEDKNLKAILSFVISEQEIGALNTSTTTTGTSS